MIAHPRFREGEETCCSFVTEVGATVLYLEQGAYRVNANDRGDRVVRPLVSNAVLVDTQRGQAVAPSVNALSRIRDRGA